MTKTQTKKLIKRLKTVQKIVAEQRDELNSIEDEATALGWNCDDAQQSIQQAIDSLSELC